MIIVPVKEGDSIEKENIKCFWCAHLNIVVSRNNCFVHLISSNNIVRFNS